MRLFHRILIFSLIFFTGLIHHQTVSGQRIAQSGAPYIQAIGTQRQGIFDTNKQILQNSQGVLFIQNTNGFHILNGNSSYFITTPSLPELAIVQDTVFIGCKDQLYRLNPYYTSTADSLLIPVTSTGMQGSIKKLFSLNNQLFLLINHRLFTLKGDKQLSNYPISDEPIEKCFPTANSCWLCTKQKLIRLKGTATHIFPLPPNREDILKVVSWHSTPLIFTKKQEIERPDTTPLPLSEKVKGFIHLHKFADMVPLNDSLLAIGTQSGGILIVHRMGKQVKLLGTNSGLYDINIESLFLDNNKTLWASHEKGISRIEYPSASNYFTQKHGIRGVVNAVKLQGKYMYLGTTQGILIHEPAPHSTDACFSCPLFTKIEAVQAQVFNFFQFQDNLFASTSEGIYRIEGKEAFLYFNRDKEKTNVIHQSKHHTNTLYMGTTDGLRAIIYQNGLFLIKPRILGITGNITSLKEDNAGNLFATTTHGFVYRILPYTQYKAALPYKSYSPEAIDTAIKWTHLYQMGYTIGLSTNQGIYDYNPQVDQFTPFELKDINSPYRAYPMATDSLQNIWLNLRRETDKKPIHTLYFLSANTKANAIPIPLYRTQEIDINSILPQNDGSIWFGGFEQLIHYRPQHKATPRKNFHTFITRITLGQDSVLVDMPFTQAINCIDKKINARYNNPHFHYTSTSFESENNITYQTRLVGLNSQWSNWETTTSRSFTNLRKGDYQFEVRSKDIYGNISSAGTIAFTIKPPFRNTTAAYILYALTLALFIYLVITWRAYFFAKERLKLEGIISSRTEELILQKEKADNLLERVLPKATANDLKSGKKAKPTHYNLATVLFSDIQGFTKISEQVDSEHLIDELDRFFLAFDNVVDKYNIEKIKTIGDAYMCAGGIPKKNRTNPVEVVLAAMEMQYYMKVLKHQKDEGSDKIWDLRIGIDTGPVVAAVLGRNRISFDIWGTTVNTASRMEASSEPGKINITENTYMLIKEFFICTYRGKMPVKYKGEVDMYFVEGFKPKLASDLKGMQPNQHCFTQLQSLRWHDLEEFVMERLEQGLPSNLYYHNVKHTIDVVTQVELIGRSEGVSEEDILLLKSAALLHDMGHLVNYDTHEEEGIKLAEKILPEFKYSERQISVIINLIKVTAMPPRPTNLLEEIMCDADLDYLGRTDFVPVAYNLYKELSERNKIGSLREWNNMQMEFIKKHHYFTQTAKKLREVNKMNQLEKIEKELRQMEEQDKNT